MSFAQFDVRLFAKSFEGQTSVRLQSWVEYESGEIVTGKVQTVEDIEIDNVKTDRLALVGHRRPNRRLGGHAQIDAAFVFIGDQWSHRNNSQYLAQTAQRGDTVLQFENDVSVEENGGLQPGDMLIVQAENTPYFREKTNGGHPRQQDVTILSVQGNRVEIDQPLRLTYPVTEGDNNHVSFIKPRFPIDYVGLEELVIQFPNRLDWLGAVKPIAARNFWMRDVRVDDAGRWGGFLQEVKNAEMRDCEFIGSHWPYSGSSAYVGFAGCHDSLMENVVGVNQRHGPDMHGGSGNVVRNSVFSGSDMQWHNGYGCEHLLENVTVGGYAFGGGYGGALHTPDSGNQIHSSPGHRNVVWNCDLFGRDYGVRLGGGQQGWIFAYNRIKTERGPAITLRDRQTNHLIIGNTFIMEDLFAPVILHGSMLERDLKVAESLATRNYGNDLVGNTIYGSNKVLSDGWEGAKGAKTPLRRSYANRIMPADNAAPRPEVSKMPMSSVFEAQRQNPNGLPPKGAILYKPDSSLDDAPDEMRSLGKLVTQVNFCRERDVKDMPSGWSVETGKVFGERDGEARYGWNVPVASGRSNLAGSAPGAMLYDTNNNFGNDPGSQWTIELPPGRYEVDIALGDSRYPFWGAYNSYQLDTTYDAVNDIVVNGTLLKDRDGYMDRYDVYQAMVTVDADRRLTFSRGPKATVLRIQFVRIHEALTDRQ